MMETYKGPTKASGHDATGCSGRISGRDGEKNAISRRGKYPASFEQEERSENVDNRAAPRKEINSFQCKFAGI